MNKAMVETLKVQASDVSDTGDGLADYDLRRFLDQADQDADYADDTGDGE